MLDDLFRWRRSYRPKCQVGEASPLCFFEVGQNVDASPTWALNTLKPGRHGL
jgi:hypothetical protein